MIPQWPAWATETFRAAEKRPLGPSLVDGPLMGRRAIEGVLPHRGTFLLLDGVTWRAPHGRTLAARYDLARARVVLADHFPTRPVYPGVLQVEAIAQAGILCHALQHGAGVRGAVLTDVLGARFLRPVHDGAELEIVTTALDEQPFVTAVGQCLQDQRITAVAAVRVIVDLAEASQEE